MRDFFNWLEGHFPGGVILVGHGIFSDKTAHDLVVHFRSAGFSDDQIRSTINGFSDTLVAFPKKYPDPGKYSINNFCLILTSN